MKLARILVSAVLAVSAVVVLTGKVSAAQQNEAACEVYARSYSQTADQITAVFEVKKIDNSVESCTKDVTLAAFNAPNGVDGKPFDQQTFHDSKSGTFAVGYGSLTVSKPKCFYQVDLVRGLSPFGPGGEGSNYADWQYVSSTHGGSACQPTPTPTPTPTPAPVQPVGTGGPVAKSLPNTGAADILGISAATGAAAGIVHSVRRRFIKK